MQRKKREGDKENKYIFNQRAFRCRLYSTGLCVLVVIKTQRKFISDA